MNNDNLLKLLEEMERQRHYDVMLYEAMLVMTLVILLAILIIALFG